MKFLIAAVLVTGQFAFADTSSIKPDCERILGHFEANIAQPYKRKSGMKAVDDLLKKIIYTPLRRDAQAVAEFNDLLKFMRDSIDEQNTEVRESLIPMRQEYAKFSLFSKMFGKGAAYRTEFIQYAELELKKYPEAKAELKEMQRVLGGIAKMAQEDDHVMQAVLVHMLTTEDFSERKIKMIAQSLMSFDGDLRAQIQALTVHAASFNTDSDYALNLVTFLQRQQQLNGKNVSTLYQIFKNMKSDEGGAISVLFSKALYAKGKTQSSDVTGIKTLYKRVRKIGDVGDTFGPVITYLLTLTDRRSDEDITRAATFFKTLYKDREMSTNAVLATGPILYLKGLSAEDALKQIAAMRIELQAIPGLDRSDSYPLLSALLTISGDVRKNLRQAEQLIAEFKSWNEFSQSNSVAMAAAVLLDEARANKALDDFMSLAADFESSDISSSIIDMSSSFVSDGGASSFGDCGGSSTSCH